MKRKICLIGLCLYFFFKVSAQSVTNNEVSPLPNPGYYGQGVAFGGSLTVGNFSQCGIWVTSSHIFATYWDANRLLHLARKSLTYGSSWVDIQFPDVQNIIDSHCTPTVGVSPVDSTIHLAYGMHAVNLRYRISMPKASTIPDASFNIQLFGEMKNYLTTSGDTYGLDRVTYPNFVIGNSGKLLLFWRDGYAGNGDTYISQYTASAMPNHSADGTWSHPAMIISGAGTYQTYTSRSAYPNDIRWYNNKIYLTWDWREINFINHDLCYASSTDNGLTWNNSAGSQVCNSSTVMNLNSPGIVVKSIPFADTITNNMGEAVDKEGNVHTFLLYRTTADKTKNTYYHVWRNASGTWITNEFAGITPALTRPKLYCDVTNDILYAVGLVHHKITIYSSKASDSFGKWYQIYQDTNGHDYGETNGYITFSGNLLYVYTQQNTTSTSSEIDLIKFTLNPNGTPINPITLAP